MRMTVRLDDDLWQELKRQARLERITLSQVLNRAVQLGLEELLAAESKEHHADGDVR
jgi:hypothetical protein